MADVSSDLEGVVSSDGAWSGVLWLGLSEKDSSSLDGVGSLPDHLADWTHLHVGEETWEEWLALEVSVVGLELLVSWLGELETDELESLLLESADDFSDESSLDSVWLDHNESSLVGHFDILDIYIFFTQNL